MEIHFQQQKKVKTPFSKTRARNTTSTNNKLIGVRQRPSGRWVAEIKDTTHKIRMWLGTFETAEEAARAYDEAAFLLRGSNTRMNFATQASPNSPLASRIRNLLNSKKTAITNGKTKAKAKHKCQESSCPSTSQDTVTSSDFSTADANTNTCVQSSLSDKMQDSSQLLEDVYKPDLSNCVDEFYVGLAQSSMAWDFDHGPDQFSLTQELLDLPKNVTTIENSVELSEFECMKVERQISASLYAINGLREILDTMYDPNEALWDLPPLYPLLS